MGVIFDMDGVLVNSTEAHYQSWVTLAFELGRVIPRELFVSTFGRTNQDIVPILFSAIDEEQIVRLSRRKEELYRDAIRASPPIMPGAVTLLHALRDAGVRLAIGSSGPRENIELIVNAMGVAALFSAVVTAEDVLRGKPAPDVFLTAADRLGLAPAHCVVIEDAPAGVQAARAAGTLAVALLSTHRADEFPSENHPHAPHATVESLGELNAEWLARLF